MTNRTDPSLLLCLVALTAALGCKDASGPRNLSPVTFRLAASMGSALTGGAGAIEITSLRLVIGQAALGNGDQFGCVDCQGNDGEAVPQPQLIDVPADGTPISVKSEQVTAGRYSSAEIELAAPDNAVLASMPGWPQGATVEVAGKSNGTDFTLFLSLAGSFREPLNPSVDVTDGVAPSSLSVTVTLPVTSWFVSNGAALDPNNPSERAKIGQNAQSSLDPVETGETGGGEGQS